MHGKQILILFLALLALLSSLTSQAQPIAISEGKNWIDFAEHLHWYRDASGEQSIEQIIQQDQAGLFVQAEAAPSFGYTNDAIWIRFNVYNDTTQHNHWLLSINPPFLDDVQLFQVNATGVIDLGTQGDHSTWTDREVQWRNSVYDLSLPIAQTATFYVRIKSTSSIAINISLWESNYAISRGGSSMLLFGGLIATGIITAALGLFFFFLLHQRIYLVIMFYTLSVTFIIAHLEGVVHFLVRPTTPLYLEWLQILCQAIALISMVLILCDITNLKNTHPQRYRFFLRSSVLLASAGCIPLLFGQYGASISFLWLLVGLLLVAVPILIFRVRHQLGQTAWLYIIAFSIIGSSIPLRLFWVFGLAESPTFHAKTFPLATLLHVIILFVIMTVHYIRFVNEMNKAKRAALATVADSEKRLQLLVEQRTGELDSANQQLATQLALSKQNAAILEKTRIRISAALQAEKNSSIDQRHFLRMVAHEFRTPLSVIQIATDIISNDPRTPDIHAKTNCVRIQQASERIASVINQALQEDKLDAISWRKNAAFITLCELLNSGRQYGEMASGGKQKIELNCNENLVIQGDKDLLQTMINNIIDNAVKYSPKGSVIEICGIKKVGGAISIVIRDYGPGMSDDELQQSLEKYFRGGSGDVPGMGLGLYLVDRIVRLHNATLKIERPSGGGLSFTVTFPSLILTKEYER